MKIKKLLMLGLGAVALLSGCVHGHEYVMYTGQQQNWPTQKGAFIVTKYAVPIYWRSHPDRPYNVMAVLDGITARICVDASADMAKDMHADAIVLLTEGSVGGGVSVGTAQPNIGDGNSSRDPYLDTAGSIFCHQMEVRRAGLELGVTHHFNSPTT